ncbi:MAG: hypothetical protein GX316_09890 [Firmicutes bacterium]|nr:hypothetical protein [Bacillota bacterium]
MKRWILVLLVGLVAFSAAQGVLAFGRGGLWDHGHHKGHHMMERQWGYADGELMESLDITPEEQQALVLLYEAHWEKTRKMHLHHEQLLTDLDNLWNARPLDAQAVKAKEMELVELQLELAKEKEEFIASAQGLVISGSFDEILEKHVSSGVHRRMAYRRGIKRGCRGWGGWRGFGRH